MEEQKALEIFEKTETIIAGHFVFTSGLHGQQYFNKDAVSKYPLIFRQLCEDIASHFAGQEIDVVVGPTLGGIKLADRVAEALSTEEKEVLGVYAERGETEGRILKRGFDKDVEGRKILIVEDVLTTGLSARETVEAVRRCGGEIVGIGVLCNRGKVTVQKLGEVPDLYAIVNIDMIMWTPEECPLCKSKEPINTQVGKGRQWLETTEGRAYQAQL